MNVWLSEYRKHFRDRLTMKLFHGNSAQCSSFFRQGVTVNQKDLGTFLAGLDRNDPATARTVVLTAYSTWSGRCFGKVDNEDEDDEENDDTKMNDANAGQENEGELVIQQICMMTVIKKGLGYPTLERPHELMLNASSPLCP